MAALNLRLSRFTDLVGSAQTQQTVEMCVATPNSAHNGGKEIGSKAARKASGSKAKKPVVHEHKPGQSKAKRVKSTVKGAKPVNKNFKTRSTSVRHGVIAWLFAAIVNTAVSVGLDP
ncbi:hypothetical protein P0D69_28090 [Paraburkholderia sediminicola]|uniref:hypothetical protein n=1 Tax=Paraburkholderia sediminicola TaxID=458836 RepID=UPI0038B9B87E